jgi:transposase-like protein
MARKGQVTKKETPTRPPHPALRRSKHEVKPTERCPYCGARDIVKKGIRKNKYGAVQLFYCHHCAKKFSPLTTKGKSFPLKVILASISAYNRFHTLEDAAKIVSRRYGIPVSRQNLKNWLRDFSEYLPVTRLRDAIAKSYPPRRVLLEHRLLHGQVYEFKYHRAKAEVIVGRGTEHAAFQPLLDFFERVPRATPDEIFRDQTSRASTQKHAYHFPVDGVHIEPKDNAAKKIAAFVLQSVATNKLRHETLQEFMLLNDSVTVAVEVPIVLSARDVSHMKEALGFAIPFTLPRGAAITGHIDFVQIRNGMVHILDYKPGAKTDKPIEQLTIYALALSRLTGLRLFHFKCAWFDGEHFYEFYPLHVVHKPRGKALPQSAATNRPPVGPGSPRRTSWPEARDARG